MSGHSYNDDVDIVRTNSRVTSRFLDLKKEKQERKRLVTKIRTHALVIRDALLFQTDGQGIDGDSKLPSTTTRVADLSSEELVSVSREHEISLLQRNGGGVKGVGEKLKSDLGKLKATETQVKVDEWLRGLRSCEQLGEAPPQSKAGFVLEASQTFRRPWAELENEWVTFCLN